MSVVDDISRRKEVEALLVALYSRALDVLGGIVGGKTNGEIADEMGDCANTK
jgi:FixJ family two-component response regulator